MQSIWQKRLTALFIAFPLISLTICAISWLRFGIDLPYMDDWREYNTRMLGSYDLSYLFTSANDTMYPVGKFLDSLAYNTLNGNAIPYQFISMLSVLGGLLYFQWKLLNIAIKDRLISACAFVFTLLMLQPDSYWGLQNLAYHQGLPTVGILAAIFILVRPKWSIAVAVPSLFITGLLAGFSYISGALSILTVSFVWLFAMFFTKDEARRRLLYSGVSLMAAGLITTACQLWVILVKQGGTHRPDAPMGFPWESDFWYYYLGKLARSMLLPTTFPVLSMIIAAIAVVMVLSIFGLYFRDLISKKIQTLDDIRPALIFASVFGAIFVYLCLVSAGRVNLRFPETQTPIQIFVFAFQRFHYFWATLLWPWVAAPIFIYCYRKFKSTKKTVYYRIPVIIATLFCLTMIPAKAFTHAYYFKTTMAIRESGVRCMLTLLAQQKDVFCPQLDLWSLSEAYKYGVETKASFVRTLPIVPPN